MAVDGGGRGSSTVAAGAPPTWAREPLPLSGAGGLQQAAQPVAPHPLIGALQAQLAAQQQPLIQQPLDQPPPLPQQPSEAAQQFGSAVGGWVW